MTCGRASQANDEFWKASTFTAYAKISWPVVMEAAWFDIFQADTLDAWDEYRSTSKWEVRDMHRLVIDPLGHCGLHGYTGNLNTTAMNIISAMINLENVAILKCYGGSSRLAGLAKWRVLSALIPRMIWMVMSSSGGYVTSRSEWPAVAPTSYYLTRVNATNSSDGLDGTLSLSAPTAATIQYTYNPSNPCPSTGGNEFFDPGLQCGPADTNQATPRIPPTLPLITARPPLPGAHPTGRAHL